jgi:hypothetical protein
MKNLTTLLALSLEDPPTDTLRVDVSLPAQ